MYKSKAIEDPFGKRTSATSEYRQEAKAPCDPNALAAHTHPMILFCSPVSFRHAVGTTHPRRRACVQKLLKRLHMHQAYVTHSVPTVGQECPERTDHTSRSTGKRGGHSMCLVPRHDQIFLFRGYLHSSIPCMWRSRNFLGHK